MFDEKGTFEYTVSEENGRDYSFNYDDTVYTVRFTVDDDGTGQLKAVKSITYGQDETPTNEIAFTNAYTAPDGTQAVFELNKDYTALN